MKIRVSNAKETFDMDLPVTISEVPALPGHPAPLFAASPATLQAGQSTTLSWNAPGASGLHLDGLPVTGPSNTLITAPIATTTYTFTASYEGEADVVLTATVTVTPAPVPAGVWAAEYFANTTLAGAPVLTQQANAIAFDWKTGSPGANVPADKFSARFTRQVTYPAGDRAFTVRADDGVRVWLDGELILDFWVEQAATNHQVIKAVTAGVHSERVEYFEQGGLASLAFDSAPYVAPPPVVGGKPGRRGTGIHMLSSWNNAETMLARGCKDAVFMDPTLASQYADRLGKTDCFDGRGLVMVRHYDNGQWPTFEQVMSYMGYDKRLLYIVTNEGEGLNKPDPVEAVYAHAALDIAVAREMAKRGCHAAVNTLATGNPDYTSPKVCAAIRAAYAPWWNTFEAENLKLYGKSIKPVWDQHDYSPSTTHIFDTWEGDIAFALAPAPASLLASVAYEYAPEVVTVMVGDKNPHPATYIPRPASRKVGLAKPASIAGSKTVHIYEQDWYETRARFNVYLCGFDATKGVYVSSETLVDVGGKGGALGCGWGPADVLKWDQRYYEIWGRPISDEYGNTVCLNKEGGAIYQGTDPANGSGHWGSYYVGGMVNGLAPMWARR